MYRDMRHDPPRLCESCGKHHYRSEKAAWVAAQRRQPFEPKPLRVYFSARCCSFHISSKPLKEVAP